jgi:hypothetical protein
MKFSDKPTEEKNSGGLKVENTRSLTSGLFGFALLASPNIKEGRVTFSVVVSNRTDQEIEVRWRNSHLFLVHVIDASGVDFDVAQLLPAPQPQDPTKIPAGQDFAIVFPVDTSQPPYSGKISFDPAASPYRFLFEANAENLRASGSITLDVEEPSPEH